MFERTLTLSSDGKSYSLTGWKVGWPTGPAELAGAVLSAKQWLTFTSGSPLQPAVAFALDEEPDFPLQLAARLQEKRDLLCTGLGRRRAGGPLLRPPGPAGARLEGRPVLLPGPARTGRRGRHPDPGVLRL